MSSKLNGAYTLITLPFETFKEEMLSQLDFLVQRCTGEVEAIPKDIFFRNAEKAVYQEVRKEVEKSTSIEGFTQIFHTMEEKKDKYHKWPMGLSFPWTLLRKVYYLAEQRIAYYWAAHNVILILTMGPKTAFTYPKFMH